MSSLLYLCTGNVCRSPFAERLTRHRLEQSGNNAWTVASSGIGALVDAPMDALMAAELEQRGGRSEGFRARQAAGEELAAADLVVAMSHHHRDWILEEWPVLLNRTFTLGQIVRFAQEEGAGLQGQGFLDALRAHRSRPRGRDDVPDPYRRGPQVAAECAQLITDMLEVFLPRLPASS